MNSIEYVINQVKSKSEHGMKMRVALNMEIIGANPCSIIYHHNILAPDPGCSDPQLLLVKMIFSSLSLVAWLSHTISKEAGRHVKVSFCRIFTHEPHMDTPPYQLDYLRSTGKHWKSLFSLLLSTATWTICHGSNCQASCLDLNQVNFARLVKRHLRFFQGLDIQLNYFWSFTFVREAFKYKIKSDDFFSTPPRPPPPPLPPLKCEKIHTFLLKAPLSFCHK